MSKFISQQAFDIASEAAEKYNIEVIDSEFVKEGKDRFLRIYLYKPEGITIDDCEKVHRDIDDKIDNLDIKDSYILEVSSLGYDKNLKNKREFEIVKNTKIAINLYKQFENSKYHEGILIDRTDDFTIINANGTEIKFVNNDISKINRVFE